MPRITMLGASTAGVLYDVERPPYDGGGGKWTYLKPAGLAPYEVPPQTLEVAVGASNVTYVDNQLGRFSLHRRWVTRSGSTVTLGGQTNLGEIGQGPVARDGRRTAYLDQMGDLWLATDDGIRTRMFDAATKVAIVQTGGTNPFRLSGHRMLWVKATYSGEYCEPWGLLPDIRQPAPDDV